MNEEEDYLNPLHQRSNIFAKIKNIVGINFSVIRIRQLRPKGFEEPA